MDAEQAAAEPSGLRPTTAQQYDTARPTANGPEPTVPTAKLCQLPTPTTYVGTKPPRYEIGATYQHCAKYGSECTTKHTEQRTKHKPESKYRADTSKCTEYHTKSNDCR